MCIVSGRSIGTTVTGGSSFASPPGTITIAPVAVTVPVTDTPAVTSLKKEYHISWIHNCTGGHQRN